MFAPPRHARLLLVPAILATTLSAAAVAAPRVKADLVLLRGMLADGTDEAPKPGNLAIRGDRIVAVGQFGADRNARTIDCTGLVIAPGFIDLHNHSDLPILEPETRAGACYLTQGCTTLVTGNCGAGHHDVRKFYGQLEQRGCGVNVAHLLPHGALRDQVMGKVRRPARPHELRRMRGLVLEAMRAGSWGMSTGLQYVPGSFADTDELVSLAEVVARHGGLYASHMRDEGDLLVESVRELIEIAERAKIRAHISHFKASKQRNWGKVRVAAQEVEQARNRGLQVTADQYPYNASSTSILAMLLPDEEREGGEQATIQRLQDPLHLTRLRPLIAEALAARGKLMIASFAARPDWVGQTIREVAQQEQREPLEIALEILRGRGARGVNFSMDEHDVRYVMTLPWVATASDGSSKVDDGTRPHPRSFGTFPRKIGYYAIEQEVMSLAAAVRSASGLPADILEMPDRGYLRVGYVADVVVFDPERLRDRATYQQPFELSTGVQWVFVNGRGAIEAGELKDLTAGQALRHTARGESSK